MTQIIERVGLLAQIAELQAELGGREGDAPPAQIEGARREPGANPPLSSRHVLQRLQYFDEDELRDPVIENVFGAQEFVAAALHFDVELDRARALIKGAVPYPKLIKDGVWSRFKAWTGNFNVVLEDIDLSEPARVGEIHCPNIDGASGVVTAAQDRERQIGLVVRAAGLGGGGWTMKRSFHKSSKVTINAGHCAGLYVSLSGDYSLWQHVDDAGRVLALVNVTGVGTLYDSELIEDDFDDPQSHLCYRDDGYGVVSEQVQRDRLRLGEEYDGLRPTTSDPTAAPHEHSTKWTTSRKYDVTWGLSVKFKGAEIASSGGQVTSTFVDTVEALVRCPKNRHYLGRFRSAEALPQQWVASEPIPRSRL